MFKLKSILPVLFLLFPLILPISVSLADEESDKLHSLESQIEEYKNKIKEAQAQQQTLATTITVFNNKIYLLTAQIQQTNNEIKVLEEEIGGLSIKINQLDGYLNQTTLILKERIEATYKRLVIPQFQFIFTAESFSDFLSKLEYLKIVQKHDKELLYKLEETRINFNEQKELKEKKQAEIETLRNTLNNQKINLESQKIAKQDLLRQTKNDETRFQQLLSQARAEYESIQAIIAGRGDEEKVSEVKAGDKIASVISGSSCNSSGTHLHFTVASKGNAHNPFNYLSNIDHDNCSGPGECSGGDSFNPSGSWSWPLNPKIRMNQGYGATWAIQNTWVGSIYSFHNGIDIVGSDNNIKAVQDGTLYRGSYGGSGGCRLRYVRVDHKDSDLETYYLHVNY